MADTEPCFREIRKHPLGLNFDQIIESRLDHLVVDGLKVATLCLTGSKRSQQAAQILVASGIPAVCIQGGLWHLKYDLSDTDRTQVVNSLRQVPIVAVFLTPLEKKDYLALLNQWHSYYFKDPHQAVASIRAIQSA